MENGFSGGAHCTQNSPLYLFALIKPDVKMENVESGKRWNETDGYRTTLHSASLTRPDQRTFILCVTWFSGSSSMQNFTHICDLQCKFSDEVS